jgi:hypothetical protein
MLRNKQILTGAFVPVGSPNPLCLKLKQGVLQAMALKKYLLAVATSAKGLVRPKFSRRGDGES